MHTRVEGTADMVKSQLKEPSSSASITHMACVCQQQELNLCQELSCFD